MEWKKITEEEPKKFEEVIICSDTGKVKPATYFGGFKWSTYLQVALWMPMPDAPAEFSIEHSEPEKKKRGRKKIIQN